MASTIAALRRRSRAAPVLDAMADIPDEAWDDQAVWEPFQLRAVVYAIENLVEPEPLELPDAPGGRYGSIELRHYDVDNHRILRYVAYASAITLIASQVQIGDTVDATLYRFPSYPDVGWFCSELRASS